MLTSGSYTAATVSDLIADINAANAAGGTNTITLTAPTTSPYVLNAVDNTTDGSNGLPVISGGSKRVGADNLTILGNGDTIERSTASGTPAFRPFDVASGASLTLENLTLQNGLAFGSGSAAEGGAIYNQGTLVLSGATVQNNQAEGSNGADATKPNQDGGNGQDAVGGGIFSNGSLTLENSTVVQNNATLGGNGGNSYGVASSKGGNGGSGFGAGVDIAGGSGNMAGGTLSGNVAQGGAGGAGFYGFGGQRINFGYRGGGNGGGVSVNGGTANLTAVTVDGNQADLGYGGGLNVASGTAYLTDITVDSNQADLGGGVSVLGGMVSLSNDTVDSNAALSEGGGLDLVGGSVTVSGGTVDSNSAGYLGGGMFIWGTGTTVTLCNLTVEQNTLDGYGGGGISIATSVYVPMVYIDSFTVAQTINNTDRSGKNGATANIYGPYTLQNC
jgi:hypothetical protein